MHYLREIPQNYHRFVSTLIPQKLRILMKNDQRPPALNRALLHRRLCTRSPWPIAPLTSARLQRRHRKTSEFPIVLFFSVENLIFGVVPKEILKKKNFMFFWYPKRSIQLNRSRSHVYFFLKENRLFIHQLFIPGDFA